MKRPAMPDPRFIITWRTEIEAATPIEAYRRAVEELTRQLANNDFMPVVQRVGEITTV